MGFVSKHCHLMGATIARAGRNEHIGLRDSASHRSTRWYCEMLSHLTHREVNLVLADPCLRQDLCGHKCRKSYRIAIIARSTNPHR